MQIEAEILTYAVFEVAEDDDFEEVAARIERGELQPTGEYGEREVAVMVERNN